MIIQKPDGDLHSKVHGNYFEASYGWSTSLMPHSAFTFRVRLAFKDSRIICRASSLMHALGPLCFFILDAPSLEEVTHHLCALLFEHTAEDLDLIVEGVGWRSCCHCCCCCCCRRCCIGYCRCSLRTLAMVTSLHCGGLLHCLYATVVCHQGCMSNDYSLHVFVFRLCKQRPTCRCKQRLICRLTPGRAIGSAIGHRCFTHSQHATAIISYSSVGASSCAHAFSLV
mmetsp:Transcript_1951/g.4937  ORF Transcript_1951/g.4937 Transcript_1951/m.4937 type:complete len:226 (+) Transcript_1951:554-1231(+)